MKYSAANHSLLLLVATILGITSCQSGNANHVEPQQSSFTPAAGSPISVPGGPGNVITGDVNNDKKPDLVVACGKSRSITIMLGKGDGQFATTANPINLTHPPNELAVGDVDRDGKLDVAVGTHDTYGVMLFRGDGNGGFVSFPGSPVVMRTGDHPHTHGLALADMNRDNKLDLVSVNSTDNDVSVAFGDGRGGFTRAAKSPFPVGPSPYPFAIGDVNGDAQLDIVATATATGPMRAQQLPLSRAVTLLLADGSGGFRSIQLPLRTGEPWFAVINDINGDSKPDILVTHHDMSQLTVLLGDGRGAFVEATASPFDFGGKAFHTAVIDVNRDGKMDLLAAGGESVRVMLGDGRGGFASGPAIRTGPGAWHMALADINGDGKTDLITSNVESDTVSVLLAS
ncbi:MAG TPA: VCBS repeat-containing protein [Pyrinomonadaceae bacterium]|nr:VCBS repeat-containing protein [Pyrinomonadaceae bacterium]